MKEYRFVSADPKSVGESEYTQENDRGRSGKQNEILCTLYFIGVVDKKSSRMTMTQLTEDSRDREKERERHTSRKSEKKIVAVFVSLDS